MIAGRDPYFSQYGPPRLRILNPPTIQPFVTAFCVLPYRTGGAVWAGLNILGTVGLVEFSRRVLNRWGGVFGRPIPPEATAGLMAAVALSVGSRDGLEVGQLHVAVSLLILAALAAQASRRPFLAGLLLVPATSKPQTLLPFLILFLRRSDLATWATLAILAPLMVVVSTPPGEIVERVWSWKMMIDKGFGPGQINDLKDLTSIISFGHIMYCLGLEDPARISRYQTLVVLSIGILLAYEVAWRDRISRAAACSLVACYSMLFIYHRSYDTVILALPLVYAAAASREVEGLARPLFRLAGIALLVAMNLYQALVQAKVLGLSQRLGPVGSVLRALLIPYPTYATLVALVALWVAARLSTSSHTLHTNVRQGPATGRCS